MEEYPKQDFDNISDRFKDYIKLQVEIFKLKATEKGVRIVASLLTYLVLLVFAVLFLISGFLALGFYLSEVTGSNAAGFGCLTVILLLIVIVMVLIREKAMTKPLENKFILNIFKNW